MQNNQRRGGGTNGPRKFGYGRTTSVLLNSIQIVLCLIIEVAKLDEGAKLDQWTWFIILKVVSGVALFFTVTMLLLHLLPWTEGWFQNELLVYSEVVFCVIFGFLFLGFGIARSPHNETATRTLATSFLAGAVYLLDSFKKFSDTDKHILNVYYVQNVQDATIVQNVPIAQVGNIPQDEQGALVVQNAQDVVIYMNDDQRPLRLNIRHKD